MRLWKKGLATLIAVCMTGAALAGTALAAEERTRITSIRLNVESSIAVGDDSGNVSVTVADEDANYSVDDVEITNDDGEWLDGDVPRVKVTLSARNGYYFSSKSSSVFRFTGDDADFVSASYVSNSDKEEVEVTIKLDALVGSLDIDSAQWEDDNSPIAVWDEADGAKSYQVRLYRGSSSATELITTTNNYFNFASYITRTGDFTFKVRAVNSNSKKGAWTESDELYVDDEELSYIRGGHYGTSSSTPTSGGTAGWIKDNVGWWYRNADGSYTTNGWQLINGLWYAFDNVGYMRTGWIPGNGVWYYCDTNSGAMLTNAWTPDGYWVDANGVWRQ